MGIETWSQTDHGLASFLLLFLFFSFSFLFLVAHALFITTLYFSPNIITHRYICYLLQKFIIKLTDTFTTTLHFLLKVITYRYIYYFLIFIAKIHFYSSSIFNWKFVNRLAGTVNGKRADIRKAGSAPDTHTHTHTHTRTRFLVFLGLGRRSKAIEIVKVLQQHLFLWHRRLLFPVLKVIAPPSAGQQKREGRYPEP